MNIHQLEQKLYYEIDRTKLDGGYKAFISGQGNRFLVWRGSLFVVNDEAMIPSHAPDEVKRECLEQLPRK